MFEDLSDIIRQRKGTHGETKVLKDRWRRQFVRLGLAICDMSLGHLKERTFNRQSAVYNSSDNTQFSSHYNLRRKETETQRCQATYPSSQSYEEAGTVSYPEIWVLELILGI